MPVRNIIAFAAAEFLISEEVIMGRSRLHMIVRARHAVCAAACGAGWSLPHIGRVCGGLDHTSVLYGRDKAEIWAERDPVYAEKLARLRAFAKQPRKPWVPVVVPQPKVEASVKLRKTRKVRERNDFGADTWNADDLTSGSVALLKALQREFPARCAA